MLLVSPYLEQNAEYLLDDHTMNGRQNTSIKLHRNKPSQKQTLKKKKKKHIYLLYDQAFVKQTKIGH